MSDKVSTSLAAQLHSHALASAEAGGIGGVNGGPIACHASTDKDAQAPPLQFEMDAPAAAISAQLNFKIVPADSLPGLSYQDMFASMNTSQISNASTESSCSPPIQGAVPPPKPSRHMAVQPLNSVSSEPIQFTKVLSYFSSIEIVPISQARGVRPLPLRKGPAGSVIRAAVR